VFRTNGWVVICDFEGHMHRTDEWAFVRAVAGFVAFIAYRGLHSRAVASVVALRFERAFAVGALVFRTREARSAFVSRTAAFAAFGMSKFGCRVS
jgi:hypothetical protein